MLNLLSFLCVFFNSLIIINLNFKSIVHNHVKHNIPAKLLRIWTFGKTKLEDFKDLVSVFKNKMCEIKMEKYYLNSLKLDIFVKFLYKVIFLFALVLVCIHFMPFSLHTCLFVLERGIHFDKHPCTVIPRGHSRGS